MLTEGSFSPAWQSKDQHGKIISSLDFHGQWLLLYFYPKDDTPGCTAEACAFRDSYASLKDRIAIVGVSADSTESHQAFIQKYQLPFILLADTDRTVIDAFGANGVTFPKRVTFLIDPKNIIRKIYHGFDAVSHAEHVETDLEALGA